MVYTEAELKGKTVKDLKEIAKELGVSSTGKKDEIIVSILIAAQGGAADELDEALAEPVDDGLAGAGAAAAAGGAAPAAGAGAAGGKQAIVFALEKTQSVDKKANLVGIKTLSDAERAQLRAAKFNLQVKGGTSKPTSGGKAAAGGGGSGGISTAGGVGVGLEEEIKKLLRAQKFAKLSDKDEAKLARLQKQLEAQKQKQQLALDKAELADPEKMKQREAKFGKALVATHDPKDPEVLKKRAEKFGAALGAPKVNKPKPEEEEARKKARLARFAK